MSKLYLRNGTYYVRYRRQGKFQWKSLKTTSKKDAQAKRSQLDRALRAEPLFAKHHVPISMTFDELADFYRAWAATRRQHDTIDQTLYFLDIFPNLTDVKHVAAVTPAHITRFQDEYFKQKRTGRTINKALTMLRAAVNNAIHAGAYSGPNPFRRFTPYRHTKKMPTWLNAEQIATVLTAAEKHSPDALFIFALGIYAGLRKDEILESRWEWIDFKTRTLYVRGSETFTIKDRQERAIDLHDSLAEILKPHRQLAGHIVRPENKPCPPNYRFDLRKLFNAVTKSAELPWCTPKTLRHTFASQLAINGVELYYIQLALGHSDPKTTMVYAHLAPRREFINRIGKTHTPTP